MTFRPLGVGLALASLIGMPGVATGQQAPTAPPQEQVDTQRRLGRPYPAPSAQPAEPREDPQVYVSVVSPSASPMDLRLQRERVQRGRAMDSELGPDASRGIE